MSDTETPAEHALLGLLELNGGHGYGYELARRFAVNGPLGLVIRLVTGMLYHQLKKLERAGGVTSTRETQEAHPPRQVYRLTAAGREELRRWLAAPISHTRELRLEFLVKLYLARRLDPASAAALLDEQCAQCRRLEASLAKELSAVGGSEPADPATDRAFARLVFDLRLGQTRAALAWLNRVRAIAREGGAA
jgi:DNA-binding PadR family transcriptional regulator